MLMIMMTVPCPQANLGLARPCQPSTACDTSPPSEDLETRRRRYGWLNNMLEFELRPVAFCNVTKDNASTKESEDKVKISSLYYFSILIYVYVYFIVMHILKYI